MYEILIIIVIALVTLFTRALPFLAFKNNSSKFINFLGEVLPYSIMPMLVVYCLKNVNIFTGNHGLCEMIGVIVVISVHLFKRNNLLSIITGTLAYMLCVQIWFV